MSIILLQVFETLVKAVLLKVRACALYNDTYDLSSLQHGLTNVQDHMTSEDGSGDVQNGDGDVGSNYVSKSVSGCTVL